MTVRVLLDGSAFATFDRSHLPVLYWLGASDRHRIVVDDPQDSRYLAWRAAAGPAVTDDWDLMLDISVEADALEPSELEVRIEARQHSAWTAAPPALSIPDALLLLAAPYRIVVEDATSDRAFILAILQREERQYLERLEAEDRVLFDHGGGSRLRARVRALRGDPSRRMRMSVVFDSDALRPGAPSSVAALTLTECAEVHAHCLDARAIENYLPLPALQRWSVTGDGERRGGRRLCAAFGRLKTQQRRHFCMKSGFGGDASRAEEVGDLYADVSRDDRAALEHGFGDAIAELFERVQLVAPSDFDDSDPPLRAARSFAREVLGRIR